MKIAHVANYFRGLHQHLGGAENASYRTALIAKEQGHDVLTATLRPDIQNPDIEFRNYPLKRWEDYMPRLMARYAEPVKWYVWQHDRLASRDFSQVMEVEQPDVVHFKNYSAVEILKILAERAQVGLRRHDETMLQQIAALTAKNTSSDVRVAIKTLYYTAMEPTSDLQANFERARRDILGDVIQDLNDKTLLILRAALDAAKQRARSVYERYRAACHEVHEEPFSYVHFYSNLSYLQSLGLVLLVSTKVGKTYTNRIQPLFDKGLFEMVWQARFG